jgi:hypothetical protein
LPVLHVSRLHPILSKDVRFIIWSDKTKLGELHISQGTLDWLPARSRRRDSPSLIRVSWDSFADLIQLRHRVPSRSKGINQAELKAVYGIEPRR